MKRDFILSFSSILIFLFLWEFYYWSVVNNPFLFSPPSKVLPTFIKLLLCKDPNFLMPLDILYSLFHYAIGFTVAVALGFTFGLLMGYYKSFEKLTYPVIELLRPIPPIAWIPISILFLKLTHISASFIIFIGSFFPILLNTRHGVANVELRFIEAGKTLGAGKIELLKKIIIPAALPSILTGIRVGSGVAWMCVVAAELFGVAPYGLGYQIEIARLYHNPEVVISYMFAIGLIGFALDRVYKALEARQLKWRRGFVVE